jgi:hypothetical protein
VEKAPVAIVNTTAKATSVNQLGLSAMLRFLYGLIYVFCRLKKRRLRHHRLIVAGQQWNKYALLRFIHGNFRAF